MLSKSYFYVFNPLSSEPLAITKLIISEPDTVCHMEEVIHNILYGRPDRAQKEHKGSKLILA